MGAEMLKKDTTNGWIGYSDPNIFHLPFPYPWIPGEDSGEERWKKLFMTHIDQIEKKGVKKENICAIFMESYQGWGAVFYPDAYVKALKQFSEENGILIVCDEIQSGFGRTGKLFAYEHYGIEPDIVCMGKGLGGGVPVSAVMASKEIMDIPETGSMSSTHSANPLCAATALSNLGEIERLDLIAASARKGKLLHSKLNELKEKYPGYILRVLGKGLVAAIIITDPDTGDIDGDLATVICEKAMQKGLLLVHTGRESIKIGPPLTIPEEALVEGIEVIDECIKEIKEQT